MSGDVRRRLLDDVAEQVPVSAGADCVRVAIDGVDGSGKSTFADELADRLRARDRAVVRVSVDDFHHPRAVRYRRGRTSPEGFWLDSFDYPSLYRRVLNPLGPGGNRRYQPASHDLATDQPLTPLTRQAKPGSVVIVDGLFLHRDELAGVWDLSIFLHVPFSVSVPRMARRDGSSPDPDHPSLTRYVHGQQLYFAACTPWRRASLVIDNARLHAPAIVAAAHLEGVRYSGVLDDGGALNRVSTGHPLDLQHGWERPGQT